MAYVPSILDISPVTYDSTGRLFARDDGNACGSSTVGMCTRTQATYTTCCFNGSTPGYNFCSLQGAYNYCCGSTLCYADFGPQTFDPTAGPVCNTTGSTVCDSGYCCPQRTRCVAYPDAQNYTGPFQRCQLDDDALPSNLSPQPSETYRPTTGIATETGAPTFSTSSSSGSGSGSNTFGGNTFNNDYVAPGLSPGEKAGIAIGSIAGAVIVAGIIGCCFFCSAEYRRARRRKNNAEAKRAAEGVREVAAVSGGAAAGGVAGSEMATEWRPSEAHATAVHDFYAGQQASADAVSGAGSGGGLNEKSAVADELAAAGLAPVVESDLEKAHTSDEAVTASGEKAVDLSAAPSDDDAEPPFSDAHAATTRLEAPSGEDSGASERSRASSAREKEVDDAARYEALYPGGYDGMFSWQREGAVGKLEDEGRSLGGKSGKSGEEK